ncbi:MAG: gliding motility-associated-like protein/uncharacterized repeat protein (TIGR01451 family) [Flavobacteriales bacterium]|jgi:gliding motility-associated-like protein/uncharacterized repeat protein (TIGR01451 family)
MNFQATRHFKDLILNSIFVALFGFVIPSNIYAQCNTGDVGGTVFQDVPAANASTANVYGTLNSNENGQPGIIVTVVDAHGDVLVDTTDGAGSWSLTPALYPVRVEYSWEDRWLEISPGNNINTDVQVYTASSCNARLGLYYPDEYCQMVPNITTSCFVNGDPTVGGTAGTLDAIVSFPYDRTGDATAPTHDAIMSEVGAVWGAAYNGYNQQAFYSAVMKRHVGVGPAGIGGIYRIDYSGSAPIVSTFANLAGLGVNLGTEPVRTLDGDWENAASDSLMFDASGKMGLGDIEITDDGNTLFAVNLFERSIVAVNLTNYNQNGTLPTISDVSTLPAIPTVNCTNGVSRPFALEYRRDKLYIGMVCTAENGGTIADLSAKVVVYDFSTGLWSDAVSSFPLDYTKGGALDNTCTTWNPWIDTYDDVNISCRPTPMLTDIEFDSDNTIVLGFADRYAFQKFTFMQDNTGANSESIVNGGDILRGYFNGTNYSLENNGIIPDGGGCGLNGQGIGGGEFFCGDSLGSDHSEISLGALSLLRGTNEVMASVINPVNFNSGGVRRFNLMTGISNTTDGYQLYQTVSFPGGNGNAAKGGGVGDVELLCDAPPIELLSYLWRDEDQDGVQGPAEIGLEGVQVSLFDAAGNLLWLDTTDINGLYSFSDTLEPQTDYLIAIGKNGAFNTATNLLNDSLDLTMLDVGFGANSEKNDSDISIPSGLNAAVDGYPHMAFTTGNSGQLIHEMDAGFFPPCITPELVSIDTVICQGTTVGLKEMVYDAEPLTEFTGICYYFASLNDANLEQAFLGESQTPLVTTTYYVRKNTNDVTCFDIDSIQVTINPDLNLITSDLTICNGDTTSLAAWVVEITGQPATLNYYPTLADADAESNVLTSPVVFPSVTTEYYIRANATTVAGCSAIDSLTITVENCVFDLAMKMVLDNNSPANPGDTVAHTVWVYNQGTYPAYDIELLTFLSPGVIFDNNINGNGIWTPSTNTLTTTINGPITAGDSVSISLNLVVDEFYTGGAISNFIEITAYDDDTDNGNADPSDNDSVTDGNVFNDLVIDNETNNNPDNPNDDDDHDSETIFVNQVFDLALLVNGPPNNVSPCDTVTFAMELYNQGNMAAFDVVITDFLPTGLAFDPTLPNNSDWELVSGLPTDSIDLIGSGDFVVVYLDLVVDCAYANTTLNNFFEITGYDNDTDDFNLPPTDDDSVTDFDGTNDLNIDNEINNNPDNPNDDDDHDGFTLTVYQGVPPTTSTLNFTTIEGVPLMDLCMLTNELSGAVASVSSCGDPVNGMLIVTTPDVCVDYVPDMNFTGQDTACVLVCDVNGLCDTTFLVFTVNPLPTTVTDTIFATTIQGVSILNLCADISELIAPVNTVASCGDPANGTLVITPGDECVDYIPNVGYSGPDTACVVVCDMNGLCDTTVFVFTVNALPTLDTIYITSVVDAALPNICMDITQLSGAVSTTASCGDPVNGSMAINSPSECVGYFPNAGYIGPDTACVVLCDINAICDTTIIVFNITPDCSGIMAETDLIVPLAACGDTAKVCLGVPLVSIGNYRIYDNGTLYTGPTLDCDFDTSYAFNYSTLPGGGLTGPYIITDWMVNGVIYGGTVISMQALVDSMNTWNPTGAWILDAPISSILGGSPSDVFSGIVVNAVPNPVTLMASMNINPNGNGIEIELLNGQHEVVLEDIFLNCFDTLSVSVSCCTDLFTAPVALDATSCSSTVNFCTQILSTDITNYTITDNGVAYAGAFGACLTNASMPLDTGYHEVIFNDVINGCLDTAFVTVSCTTCPDFIADANVMAADCSALADFCLGVDPNNPADYEIRDNGMIFGGPFIGCDFDTLPSYFTIGFNLDGNYILDEWVVSGVNYGGGVTFGNTMELVDSMNVWVPSGNWVLSGLLIIGEGDINNLGPLVITNVNSGANFDTAVTPQIQPNGISIQIDTGMHVITVLEIASGCVDTAMVNVICPPPADNCDLIGAAVQNLNIADCNLSAELCLNITSTNSSEYEIFQNGTAYAGTTVVCGSMELPTYPYGLLVGGGILGPYQLGSWIVDGISFTSTFADVDELVDSMNVWNPTGNWTNDAANDLIRGADTGQAYGAMQITHIPTSTPTTIDMIAEASVTNISILLPAGNHEIIVNDLINNCSDTATVQAACISTEIWIEFTEVTQTDTICFDASELPGIPISMSFCNMPAGEIAIFTLLTGAYCLAIEGVEIGLDTACILICDDMGFCDTTLVYVSVVDNADLPDANQDSIYMTINTPISYDLTANDNMRGAEDIIFVITLPDFGELIVNQNGVIDYVPNVDYCDSDTPDKMTYAICNDIGCDTTEVFFFVPCDTIPGELSFVSGFSPNGDAVNQYFTINGLQNFPNHTLSIFNRWGNQVYNTKNYQNNWSGTFNLGGVDLPDGTYFYLFDTGTGEQRSGYLQIHR